MDTQTHPSSSSSSSSTDSGWHTVVYPKRHRKTNPNAPIPSPNVPSPNVFASVESSALQRRKALEARSLPAVDPPVDRSDEDEDEAPKANGEAEVTKVKKVKVKKPKIGVAEAAAKIDAADLAAFLVDVTGSFGEKPDIQLMRFADYFARAFVGVAAAQFSWVKLFKESPLNKIVDVPISHIPEPVYKTAVDWISQQPVESLAKFALLLLDNIFDDMAHQQAATSKNSKKPVQQISTKAQVGLFVVLAMTLRKKPEVLVSLLTPLKETKKYQGQDKLIVIVWMIAQAAQGDLVVGMYAWTRYLLPQVYAKSSPNPQSRDLLLQLVERILSVPKAKPILLNGAVRKGERLVTPSALELLWQATFTAPSASVKATERFEAIYPTLKEVALAGTPGSKAMKPVAQQLLSVCVKAMRTNNPEMSNEATKIFIWCLTQNADCFKQWEHIYLDNIEASVAVLRRLSDEWKEHSTKFSPDLVRATLKNFMALHEESFAENSEDDDQTSIQYADKYCKVILGKLNRRSKCMKSGLFLITVAVAVGALTLSPADMENWNLNKLYVMFNSARAL